MPSTLKPRRAGRPAVKLTTPGWNEPTRRALERLIRRGAGQGLPVVFDFDNTVIAGDIGEATLAGLVRSRRLVSEQVPPHLCAPFRRPDKGLVTRPAGADLMEYYELLLAPTAHGSRDPSPLANGYVWAVEMLAGLNIQEVVEATQAASVFTPPGKRGRVAVPRDQLAYPPPVFHPEMVELIGLLLRHEFEVWIVSASNVWSVRWLVLQGLNPRLRALGVEAGLRADHVIGVATLLRDEQDRLWKDTQLVREDADYAAMRPESLAKLWVTNRLQFPIPAYSGKVACILDAIGRPPYLCAGDGPGDHAMLSFSEHRLWIARLEKATPDAAGAGSVRRSGKAGWLVQASHVLPTPGFRPESGGFPEEVLPGYLRADSAITTKAKRG